MIMNEPKRFHIEPFSWLQRTLKCSYCWTLIKGSVQNLLGVPKT